MGETCSGVPRLVVKNVLLLGGAGFIGSNLTRRLLRDGTYTVTVVDLSSDKIFDLLGHPKLRFVELDIVKRMRAVERQVRATDCVVDLVAFANPSLYVSDPVMVYDLNYTYNLEVARLCLKHKKWIVQFSTCEVYGMTAANAFGKDPAENPCPFAEDSTPLIMGPVSSHRWIYACAKQLLERVLHAHGMRDGMRYTIIRPFNFVGPRIDYLPTETGGGNPRVFSHIVDSLLYGSKPIKLVNGGKSFRSYLYIDDAVDCIVKIIDDGCSGNTNQRIFNVGAPGNEVTIAQLAKMACDCFDKNFRIGGDPVRPEIISVPSERFYGTGYADCDRRIPDITLARTLLGWEPKHTMDETVFKALEYYVTRHRQRAIQSKIVEEPKPSKDWMLKWSAMAAGVALLGGGLLCMRK